MTFEINIIPVEGADARDHRDYIASPVQEAWGEAGSITPVGLNCSASQLADRKRQHENSIETVVVSPVTPCKTGLYNEY